ncbi:MAG TPA: VWA domain-containing protein [Pyrinomonadaceae bacterium]|nr:VWA domain-containing protein [Pyrinomonadaceae bacterium]
MSASILFRLRGARLSLPLCFLSAFTLALCAVLKVEAQVKDPEVISVTTRLVNVDVLVTDKRSRGRVENLKPEDFEILDNGRPVALTYFRHDQESRRPLALVLLVEADEANRTVMPTLRAGLERALKHLLAEDQVAVLAFDPFNFEVLQKLTSDHNRVLEALQTAAERQEERSTKGTEKKYKKFEALPYALLAGMRDAQSQMPQSSVALVVIGNDFDVVSGKVVDEVGKQLLMGATTVSGLLKADRKVSAIKIMVREMTKPSGGSVKTDNIAYLSRQTGGESVSVHGNEYSEALEQVIENIAARYNLGFTPDESALDGKFHELTVSIRAQAGKQRKTDLQIRARRGYYGQP